jgi:hypothetical protein
LIDGRRDQHRVMEMFGVPVVTCLRAFFTARKAAGAMSARHSLRPLNSDRAASNAKTGRDPRRGNAKPCLAIPFLWLLFSSLPTN